MGRGAWLIVYDWSLSQTAFSSLRTETAVLGSLVPRPSLDRGEGLGTRLVRGWQYEVFMSVHTVAKHCTDEDER